MSQKNLCLRQCASVVYRFVFVMFLNKNETCQIEMFGFVSKLMKIDTNNNVLTAIRSKSDPAHFTSVGVIENNRILDAETLCFYINHNIKRRPQNKDIMHYFVCLYFHCDTHFCDSRFLDNF